MKVRQFTVLTVAVLALAAVTVAPAGAQSSGAAPKATEIGVTATEIRIAVEADVDNPFAPGLFQGVVDGVRSAAKYLNSKSGGGGIGGRKLVVDFIDSKLNGNEARNGVITACQNDFAMVGTAALFLPSVDDLVGCADKAGAATGSPGHRCRRDRRSPVVFAGVVPGEPAAIGLLRPRTRANRRTTANRATRRTC